MNMSSSKCPICTGKSVFTVRPFCSIRCKEIDLARWFRGDYAISTDEKSQETETEKAQS